MTHDTLHNRWGQATIEYLLIALGAISTIVVVSAVTGSVRTRANAVMTTQLNRVNAIPFQ